MNATIVTLRMLLSNPDITGNEKQRPVIIYIDNSEEALQLSCDKSRFAESAEKVGLSPSVYLESDHNREDLKNAIANTMPSVIAVENIGIFGIGISGAIASAAARATLSGEHMPKINTHPYRLSGCAVIVTGSAQGFGKGITEQLSEHGACVVVADINDELGTAFAAELNSRHGEGTAIFCHTDVTNSESLDVCTSAAIESFGGVDMFVSNAGVLKAAPIEEMDEKSFDLVTNINYKAYFLCVKAVTPVMKLQHEINPHHFMDIIQINSKSGLQGSNKNFTYSGSKFGAIGLTQSFAMELVPYNIKVNSICPGNFFEGPLWSDPETGLFVQYLEAGKVPGAKTLDDVKEYYISKVPMRKGCSPEDVTTAILYAHDQMYETGQAIPVTGGQVMLK